MKHAFKLHSNDQMLIDLQLYFSHNVDYIRRYQIYTNSFQITEIFHFHIKFSIYISIDYLFIAKIQPKRGMFKISTCVSCRKRIQLEDLQTFPSGECVSSSIGMTFFALYATQYYFDEAKPMRLQF